MMPSMTNKQERHLPNHESQERWTKSLPKYVIHNILKLQQTYDTHNTTEPIMQKYVHRSMPQE